MKTTYLLLITITLNSYLFAQSPGQVTDTVVCQHNKNHSYALYLPSNYSAEKKWPIVYFFEPAARGALPVKRYADVAEELGYILACTYNSRNGSYDQSFKAADALFTDTENRFSIDFNKVILSGFSGGSRLALSIAVVSKTAHGVIGVGAAQPAVPAYMVLNKKDFKYAGLVGSRDMNYQEHKVFRSQMNTMEMDNILIISNLTHTWASAEDFRIALLWMEENTPKFQEAIDTKIGAERDSIPMTDLLTLGNLAGDKSLVSTDSKLAKKTLKEEAKFAKKEEQLKKILSDSVNAAFELGSLKNSSMKWVVKRAQKLKIQKQKADNLTEKMMIDRLLNYISAACFETSLQMKYQGLSKKALVGITMWEGVSGNVTYGHWLKAKIYASTQDFPHALDHLEAALKSGNFKKSAIDRDPDFEGLKKDARFSELINSYFN